MNHQRTTIATIAIVGYLGLMLATIALGLALTGCAGREPQEDEPVPEVEQCEVPSCGTFADPTLDYFSGCTDPDDVGNVLRYDNDDGTISLFRCRSDGWFVLESARCTFDACGNCYVGCGGRL